MNTGEARRRGGSSLDIRVCGESMEGTAVSLAICGGGRPGLRVLLPSHSTHLTCILAGTSFLHELSASCYKILGCQCFIKVGGGGRGSLALPAGFSTVWSSLAVNPETSLLGSRTPLLAHSLNLLSPRDAGDREGDWIQ